MTNEIIINKANKSVTFINNGIAYLQFGIADEILDLITNLQEENERLNTNLDELQNAIDNIAEIVGVPEGMCVEDVYDKIKDYKSRIDKAIDKLYCYGEVFDSKILKQFQKEMLEILQGE